MAPTRSIRRKRNNYDRELKLWSFCSKVENVASSFTSLDLAEREFGITAKVKLN